MDYTINNRDGIRGIPGTPGRVYWIDNDGVSHTFIEQEQTKQGTILDVLRGCDCFEDFELKVRMVEPDPKPPKRSKWHDTKDKLPKPGKVVEADYLDGTVILITFYSPDNWRNYYNYDMQAKRPVRWRKPPKKGEE